MWFEHSGRKVAGEDPERFVHHRCDITEYPTATNFCTHTDCSAITLIGSGLFIVELRVDQIFKILKLNISLFASAEFYTLILPESWTLSYKDKGNKMIKEAARVVVIVLWWVIFLTFV